MDFCEKVAPRLSTWDRHGSLYHLKESCIQASSCSAFSFCLQSICNKICCWSVCTFQCYQQYHSAYLLLHSLVQQADDIEDRKMLNKCKPSRFRCLCTDSLRTSYFTCCGSALILYILYLLGCWLTINFLDSFDIIILTFSMLQPVRQLIIRPKFCCFRLFRFKQNLTWTRKIQFHWVF